MKKLFFVLVCVFALMATSCGGNSATPAGAAADCIELIKAKDYEGFVETINMSENATPEEIEQAKQMYVALFKDKGEKQMEKKGGIESYTLVSEEIAEDGNTAKVKYDITYGDGSVETQKFDMVLVDGVWKQEVKK